MKWTMGNIFLITPGVLISKVKHRMIFNILIKRMLIKLFLKDTVMNNKSGGNSCMNVWLKKRKVLYEDEK